MKASCRVGEDNEQNINVTEWQSRNIVTKNRSRKILGRSGAPGLQGEPEELGRSQTTRTGAKRQLSGLSMHWGIRSVATQTTHK